MYIFVYGTLRKGYSGHSILNGSRFICETKTVEKYTLLDFGPFPGVIKPLTQQDTSASSITGEVYDISFNTLAGLDEYEGEWYFREEVKLEAGLTALMYFLERIPPMNYTTICNGNWIE